MNAESPAPVETRGRIRGRIARSIGLAAAAALVTSACAAGQVAQTADQKSTIDGVNASVGDIGLRAVSIEAPTDMPSYPRTSDAQLKMVLVNDGSTADTLTSIATPVATSWANFLDLTDAFEVQQSSLYAAKHGTAPDDSLPKGLRSAVIAPDARASFGTPEAKGAILLTGLRKEVFPGTSFKITFTFAKAGKITVTVPVQVGESPHGPVVGGQSAAEETGPE